MRTKLTPSFCQKATAEPEAERSIYWDSTLPGFGLLVTSAGHRSFVVQYRSAGRSRRMTLDGVLGLVKARQRAKTLLGAAAADRDPLEERRKAAARTEDTFESIANSYLDREGRELRTVKERRAALKRLVYPTMGKRPIQDIRRSDVVKLLDKIEDQNGPVMADRTLASIRKIMNWHASRSDDFRSPIVRGMARTNGDRKRARILTDDELRAIWTTAEKTEGPFGRFVQFLLLTGSRRNEAAAMARAPAEKPELLGADWTLPAARNKVNVELVRPLSPAALAILEKLPRIGKRGFVFTTNGRAPIGGFSRFKRLLDEASGVTGWRLHDLRRTARSLMSRAGVPSDHAERCLGHVMPGVRGVYDRHEYHAEKRQAYEMLAALVERIIDPQPNVVALRGLPGADRTKEENDKTLNNGHNSASAM
jgi:integrase